MLVYIHWYMGKTFGNIAGILPGTSFSSRKELARAGVHLPLMAGISGSSKNGADSVVISGGYVDDEDHGAYLIYTGHGGRPTPNGHITEDQDVMDSGNAGLIRSWRDGNPIRLTRGSKGHRQYSPAAGYRYDGLFAITDFGLAVGIDGFRILRFRLDALFDSTYWSQDALDAQGAIEYQNSFSFRRVRDTAMSRELKTEYDFRCQVCDTRLPIFDGGGYSEGAHIRPIGRPHLGTDSRDNLLSLCPNHHAQLDLGGMVIRDDLSVGPNETAARTGKVRLNPGHRLNLANVRYHRQIWLGKS